MVLLVSTSTTFALNLINDISVKAVGDQGGAGAAIGVDPDTPRDGTRRNPFQQDSTRFKGDNAATCGQTLGVSPARSSHSWPLD